MKLRKWQHIIVQLLIFLMTFILSKTCFDGVYVFRWTSRAHYAYLWLIVPLLTLWNKKYVAYSITIANTLGIFIGQYLGDYRVAVNEAKITPNMSVGQIYVLRSHIGVFIWIYGVLLSVFLGIVLQWIHSRRQKQ